MAQADVELASATVATSRLDYHMSDYRTLLHDGPSLFDGRQSPLHVLRVATMVSSALGVSVSVGTSLRRSTGNHVRSFLKVFSCG
jgi:hypothetical protein